MAVPVVFSMVGGAYGSEYDQGKNLYDVKCQICHGTNGKGDGPAAQSLNPRPVNFTDAQFWRSNDDKNIADTIHNGKGAMPAFPLNQDETRSIIDYMRHAFKK